ncbi:MAG: cation-transporting P-type ATPase, partial [Microcystaceae cyanobacterium]
MAVSPSPLPSPAWHTLTADETVAQLHSDRHQGLPLAQVEENHRLYGANELIETGGRTSWDILIDQFKNIMLLLLIAVAIISAAIDIYQAQKTGQFIFPKDAIAIFTVVLLNGILG